ncbi:hypothetical protein QJS10_CPA01g02095 [Acorus calamus]|uniref:EF-hand domain-containing protein n=1 Tax=Acorus calamus TaxID=4465 RepID=A0AAV9FM32_ACOCL|nr:hypothetical protein QJS10_CPA01g02095 [Acorus calamus]
MSTQITRPLLLLLLIFISGAVSRPIDLALQDPAISDGELNSTSSPSPLLLLVRSKPPQSSSAAESCEQTYGFLPCTTSAVGNLFLSIVYGYLMFIAATYLSNGSELLLEILGPGVIGGLFLPVLGALPDALLILVSGLSGSPETAQDQVLIGMGLLAGSTVMLLTLLWGSCIVVGRSEFSPTENPTRFNLSGSGITTDLWTSYAARIMVISVIPFIIVQLPKVFRFPSGERIMLLVSLLASIALLLSYCLYQVFQPWIQRRRLAYAKQKHLISGLLKHAQEKVFGKLLTSDGDPNVEYIKKLYTTIDVDGNGVVSVAELRALIIGFQLDEIDLDENDAMGRIMEEFDTNRDNSIQEEEFIDGISRWLKEAKHVVPSSGTDSGKIINDFHSRAREEHDMMIERSDEAVESIENRSWVSTKAVLLLLLGTVVAAIFADPLVDAVDNFSKATNIPSFFISFIAMPLATNSSEAVSAIIFASRKKQRTSSLAFSEIYGAVTMNNTLCLAVFLALVYLRNLVWDFSAEVLVILIASVMMGLFASFRTTFPLWMSFVAFVFYPLSLVVVYVLDHFAGWS